METQPLLKDFISVNKPIQGERGIELLKREELMREKKFQQWKANDDHTSKIKSKLEIKVIKTLELRQHLERLDDMFCD
jgi:hypothetical protein